jgi:hypothetical protein
VVLPTLRLGLSALDGSTPGRLETCDTADWKSALLILIRKRTPLGPARGFPHRRLLRWLQ